MKYLRKFNTSAEKSNWSASEEYVKPNVCLTEGTIDYNVPALIIGVSIQHIDGRCYTTEQWTAAGFSNEQANGVAVVTDSAKFVISKTELSENQWSSDTQNEIVGVLVASSAITAMSDFAGENNTALIVNTDTSGAAYMCANYEFPNGSKGYLPASGEWVAVYQNGSDIREAMSLIGGQAIYFSVNVYYWSSTQAAGDKAWKHCLSNNSKYSESKSKSLRVRPFTSL